VSAFAARDEARFGDEREDRVRQRFTVATASDVRPEDVAARWELADYPFGVDVCRRISIRWLNLGPADRSGTEWRIAGETYAAPLFHVCKHCGVVPAAQGKDANDARHRGWCPQRRAHDPNGWADVALMHELSTEAVRVLVPPVVMADDIQLVSFTAALRLGLRALLGGDPTHLDAFRAVEPGPRGRHNLVVLHDRVPGGTGYLSRFADPDEMHRLLKAAEIGLAGCQCQDEGLACCHRCLLPLVHPDDVPLARRDRALEMVQELLTHWQPQTSTDELRAIDVDPAETPIERWFRALLTRWAQQKRANPRTSAGAHGDRVTFVVRAGDHNRTWFVDPQVPLGDVRPDFVLRTDDPSVPDIAVFCDSVKFHASPTCNRTADDAAKRASLRARGYLVWAVTHQDMTTFEQVLDGAASTELSFLTPAQDTAFGKASRQIPGAGGVRAAEIRGDAMSLLVGFLQAAQPTVWRNVAQAVSLGMLAALGRGATRKIAQEDLLATASALAKGQPITPQAGEPQVGVAPTTTASGTAVLLRTVRMPRVDVVLVLDDRAEVVGGPEHLAQWRDWLAASNLLQFLDDAEPRFHALTTTQQLVHEHLSSSGSDSRLTPEWREVIDVADQSCRPVLVELADLGAPLPEPGRDGPGNEWQVDLAWPEYRIAVLVGDHPERADLLRQEDWLVVGADAHIIVREIAERRGVER
jgi:hypothetical protein